MGQIQQEFILSLSKDDTATINQLVVLSNLESANSEMIKQGINRSQRFEKLHQMATEQLALLDRSNTEHKFRKLLPGSDIPHLSK